MRDGYYGVSDINEAFGFALVLVLVVQEHVSLQLVPAFCIAKSLGILLLEVATAGRFFHAPPQSIHIALFPRTHSVAHF